MPDHKRPQPGGADDGTVRMMITPGLWATVSPETVDVVLDGVQVHAVLDWDLDTQDRFIDSLTIDKGTGVITPEMLRTLTVPALAAKAETSIRFWVNEACTEPYKEQRWPGETLEAWAARIFWISTITRKSPAEEIARIQEITVGSAHQRLTVARKMGLLENERVREAARTATKKKKGKR